MQRDLHCAVRTFARHKSMTGVSHRRNVAYVSTWPEEINETSGSHDENETGSQTGTICEGHAEGSSVADAAEPSVVDFTKDVELEKLERSYRRSDKGARFLSPQERRMFTKMIYNQFYKDEGTTLMDPAMMYQASLEIQWVEEWVASTARAKHLSIDDARREVKKSLLERVDLHKPLSYIIGSQPFFGCDIHCEAPLLCPRPETEMWTHWLVYNCLNRVREAAASGQEKDGMGGPQLKVLDMCCGTGCIGVALAKHVPSAVVTAVDILPEAVTVSKLNAQHNGIPDARYTALRSDMFECFMEPRVALSSLATAAKEGLHNDAVCSEGGEAEERPLGTILPEYVGVFDVIVSNPPYVLPNQYVDLPRTITHWESKIALVGDDYRESRQYLYFKELCVHGAKLLKPRHMRPAALRDTPNLVIEVGLQAHMVADLMEQSKLWRDVSIHLDYAQQERWVSAVSTH
jgi:methylase of polypeptide subunit release factors